MTKTTTHSDNHESMRRTQANLDCAINQLIESLTALQSHTDKNDDGEPIPHSRQQQALNIAKGFMFQQYATEIASMLMAGETNLDFFIETIQSLNEIQL